MSSKFVILLLLIAAITTSAQRNYSFGWHEESIQVENEFRFFRIFIPKKLNESVPLVIAFHHENSGMNRIFDNKYGGFGEWLNLAEKEKFILLIPNGTNLATGNTDGDNQVWNDCRENSESENDLVQSDDVKFISDLIDWSKANLSINENRIFAVGISNGGMMVYRLAIELGDKLAGAAVFLANMPIDSECTSSVRPLPIFVMNGTEDSIVPFEGGSLIGNRGKVTSTEETLNFWIRLNYLNPQKRTNYYLEDLNPSDNSKIIQNKFDRPLENPPVAVYVVVNGGHNVPSIKHIIPDNYANGLYGNQNKDVEAAAEAWRFLRNSTSQ